MADKKDYASIAKLEKEIAENATNFQQWKAANESARGTAEYNEGMSRFHDWERDLRAKLAALHGINVKANVESGPKHIDAVLDELLDNVDKAGFAWALKTCQEADPTFWPALTDIIHNQRNQPKPEPFRAQAAMPRPQFYPGYASSPYSYAAPLVTTNVPVYRPQIPKQRAVSPVRDYQKKTSAPFRDFSV